MQLLYQAIIIIIIFCSIPCLQVHSASGPQKRIVGGTEVKRAFWPWMAALVRRDTTPLASGHFCGGILIHRQWVLSAAHCVHDRLPHEFEIVLNVHDLKTDPGDTYSVRKILPYPQFDPLSLDHDLVLIQLKNAAPYPVIHAMPHQNIAPETSGIVLGWGQLCEYGNFATTLQEVEVPVVSNDICQLAFQKDPTDIQITPNVLCAGEPEGGKDACYGDSGGPLIIRYLNRWALAGIVSWGHGCARPDYYGIYTRVSSYIDFIESNVPSITLTGKVTTLSGDQLVPVSNAFVRLLNTEYMTYTDERGHYSIEVPSGQYILTIRADRYLPVVRELNLCQRSKIMYYDKTLSAAISGDINRDGKVSLIDIIALLQKIVMK